MCGIVGYVGKKCVENVLIDGLKSLEYRGYDSAGIALKNKDIQIIKSVGKISCLEEKIQNSNIIKATMGLGHTRWATHGVVNEENAHPHTSGEVTIVHNGIIENASLLRDKLISEGVKFKSETDTEVMAALINKYYNGDVFYAIESAVKEVIGSYALGIIFEDKDELFAIRKDSPLILGVGKDEYFIASDMVPIVKYTNKYMLLDEGEIAVLSNKGIDVYFNMKKIKKDILEATMEVNDNAKCGYKHYMLKEINEEPVVLENLINNFFESLDKIPNLNNYEEIHIVACGSAMYAGMIGKTLIEENANVRVLCEVASEYRYKRILYDRKTLVILISQSGETADTIAAMRKASANNVETLAIVNAVGSTIARESTMQIYINAGVEVAVATTKAYILQVAVMSLLSALAAGKLDSLKKDLKKLPRYLKEVIDRRDNYRKIAKKIFNNEDIFFIGRKIDYAIALEGSLKLKEISYIHSEAYQAGELKHGTISLIEDGIPVFAIITDGDIKDKTLSNLEEVKSRGAKAFIISNEKIDNYECIVVPKVNEYFQSILVVAVLQLIAYEVAKLRGCDIDKPKNLAKSVTVE